MICHSGRSNTWPTLILPCPAFLAPARSLALHPVSSPWTFPTHLYVLVPRTSLWFVLVELWDHPHTGHGSSAFSLTFRNESSHQRRPGRGLFSGMNPMSLRTMGLVMGMAIAGFGCSGLKVQTASRGQYGLTSTGVSWAGLGQPGAGCSLRPG